MRDMIPHDQDELMDPGPFGSLEIRFEKYSRKQAEMNAEIAAKREMEGNGNGKEEGKEVGVTEVDGFPQRHDEDKGVTEVSSVQSRSTPLVTSNNSNHHDSSITTPLTINPNTTSITSSMLSNDDPIHLTPVKRRLAAPTSIPHFPSAHEPRIPAPQIPSSPAQSPSGRSSFSPSNRPGMISMPTPSAGMASPWLTLAASSGAPTPAIGDGPGRGSPHLGYPFERLNIGGSWSGANLWSENSVEGDKAGSMGDSKPFSFATPSPPSQPAAIGPGGMSLETLARYRAMAGKASSAGSGMVNKGKAKETSTSGPENSPPLKRPLPEALAKRRASLPKNALGPLPQTGLKASSPLTTSSSGNIPGPSTNPSASNSTTSTSKLRPLLPSALQPMLSSSSSLILDVRPPSSFAASHLPTAHSLPIPSTLLRRSAFNIAKLTEMLVEPHKSVVSAWKVATDIILVDMDSLNLADNSILEGLGGKFEREGYEGNLWFVKGGYAAIEKKSSIRLTSDEAELEMGNIAPEGSGSDSGGSSMMKKGSTMVGGLGKLAFLQGSTGSSLQLNNSAFQGGATPSAQFRSDPFAQLGVTSSNPTERPGSQRGFQSGSSVSVSSSGSSSFPTKAPKLQPANPFFDNIRQNLELSHGGITERIPLNLPEEVTSRADELPEWLRRLVLTDEKEGADRLAEEFYKVELGEQRRLQAVMDWHSKGSGRVMVEGPRGGNGVAEQSARDAREVERLSEWNPGTKGLRDDYFPFSISAGVERGTKNRYKNIWPYDFSRVRLNSPPEKGDGDYINASFVQPRGTARRYIATQGPMDATYADFWKLVWEQDVRVIVMLTKQYEGGLLKCGNYWEEGKYGNLKLELESQTGGEDLKPSSHEASGFDFGAPAQTETSTDGDTLAKETVNIKRFFTLSREDRPDAPLRRIAQVQCTAWPDFDVPESPEVLCTLIRDVNEASEDVGSENGQDRADHSPVLVHCSAGIGRTGSFIIVDAVVDALRRESLGSPNRESSAVPSLPGTSSQTPFDEDRSKRSSSQLSSSGLNMATSAMDINSGRASTRSPVDSKERSVDQSIYLLQPVPQHQKNNSTTSLPSVFSSSPLSGAASYLDQPTKPTKPATSPKTEAKASKIAKNLMLKKEDKMAMDVDPRDDTPERPVSPSDSARSGSRSVISGRSAVSGKSSASGRSGISGSSGLSGFASGSASVGSGSVERVTLPSVQERSEAFKSYRGKQGASESGSEAGRPSLNSVFGSDERMSQETGLAKAGGTRRNPSPITDCADGFTPIASVLEGMRVQRMSLVQSLRQYLFVHRAIIHCYLSMVDERYRQQSTSRSRGSRDSTAATDDESGIKRRASPTELPRVVEDAMEVDEKEKESRQLAKRASFKKMRPAGLGGFAPSSGEEKGSGSGSGGGGVSSPGRSRKVAK